MSASARRTNKQRRKERERAGLSQGTRNALLVLGVCAAALIAWSNSFTAGLIYDNRLLIAMDPRIRDATIPNLRLIFTQDYWAAFHRSALYRPLATLTYLFNYAMLGNGTNPAGYHWINLALHIVNILLVYLLAVWLLGERHRALAVAALWGLHPVLTEAVTNIIGRTDELAAFGVLAGLLCHIQAADAHGRRKWAWLAGLALAAATGIFSKESAVVIVAAMALYDVTFRRRDSWRGCLAGYAAAALPLLTFFYVRQRLFSNLPPLHFPVTDNPIAGAGFWAGRLTAIDVIGKYIGLLCWPLTLVCDHSYDDIPLVTWGALPAVVLCLAAAGVALSAWRRHKPLFWFVLFFFGTLAPVSNLVIPIGTIMADRLMYLPAIGFAGCLVLAVYAAAGRLRLPPRAAPAILAAICVIFMIRTYARNADWQDAIALWTSAVESAPRSYKAHTMLASAWADTGDAGLTRAIAEVAQARRIMDALPNERKTPLPYIDAGNYLAQRGDFDRALESLQRAREIEAANNRVGGGESIWYELYLQLGGVYLKKNDPATALKFLEYGRDRHPVPEFFEQISVAHFQMGELRRAAIALHEGRMLFPEHPRFEPALRVLYERLDPAGCARSLDPNCPTVGEDLSAARKFGDRLRFHQFPRNW